jgi:uncharacterized C2H2 Zn-finger protein
MSDYDLQTWIAIAQRDAAILEAERNAMLNCPDCGYSFQLADAWDTDIACCVHHCDGQEIADIGCPKCGARVKGEIKSNHPEIPDSWRTLQ